MPWRQVLVALICTGLTVRSSPCSWVEVLSSWSQGYKAVVKLQMEETVDHWDVDVEFSESVINFEAWKGHVNKISDTYYAVSNTCYNNMVYSCQCFELPYIVRHEPMWEGNTTFKFNGDLVPACEPPSCDDSSSGVTNTTSTTQPAESLTTSELTENLNVVSNILNDLSSLGRKRYKRQSNGFTKDENEFLDTLAEYTTYLNNECSTKSGSCQSKTLAAYGSKLNSIFQKVKNSGGISSGFVDEFKEKYEQLKEATKTAVDTQAENSCKANGKPCIFPFKDDAGQEHNTCADYKGRYFWCATRVNSKGKYVSWEKCPDDGRCPLPNNEKTTTTTPPPTKQPQQGVSCMAGSKPCVFPFKDTDGTEYNECADYKGRYFWCATAVNSKGTFTNWGKCTECQDPNTTPSTPEDCSCTNYINQKGYGDCQKGHPDFSNAEICYVKLPSTCSDLRVSKTDPGKMASAEACKKDCSCTDYINKKGYGQCKKGHPDFKDAGICYVKLPSTCSDLKESKTDPGKMASAEACKKVDGDDSCCQELDIVSTGAALEHQGARLGSYKKQAEKNDGKPVYLQEGAGGNYLFYRETFGWLISRQGPQSTSKGGIMADSEAECPTDGGMQWKIYDRVTYDNIDSTFKLKCKGSDTTVSNHPTKPQGSCLANGKPCIFPFKDDDGTSYNGCPKYEGRYYWCATSLKTNGVYKVWEHCPEDGSCPLLNDDDSSTPAALPKPTTKPSESSETTSSAMWEPGTTSFYISDGNNNYKCEISFKFNANKKTEFRAISSTCSESNKQEDVMQYVGKHNFSLQSKDGATLECFVGVSIARGDLCQTVLEDSLNCDAKSESTCGKTRAGGPDKRWDLQECPDGYQTSIDAGPLYTLMDWTKEGGEYTKQDCVDACKGVCKALIYTHPCNQCKLLTDKEYAKDKTKPEHKYCLKSSGKPMEDTCCDTLIILSSRGTAEYQFDILGMYKKDGRHNNKPVYKQQEGSNILFFSELDDFKWVVGASINSGGGLRSKTSETPTCPIDVKEWEYYVQNRENKWIVDISLTVECDGENNVESPCDQSNTKSTRLIQECKTHSCCKDPARPYCQHPIINLPGIPGKSYCRTAPASLCRVMELRKTDKCINRFTNTFCQGILGECIECDENNSQNCKSQNLECNTETNKCVECTNQDHCKTNGKHFCDIITNTCVVECVINFDCVGNPNGGACDSTTNRCVPCLRKGDCEFDSNGAVCNLNTKSCVECVNNPDCLRDPKKKACDSTKNTCVECLRSQDCRYSLSHKACDSNTMKCVACIQNGDCKKNGKCDLNTKTCIECVQHSDCTVATKTKCNANSKTCVQCVINSDCTGNPNGDICNPTTNKCVQCLSNIPDCQGTGNPQVCNLNTNKCVGCITDADCPTPSNGCNKNNICVEKIQCTGFQYNGEPEVKIFNYAKVEKISFHLNYVAAAAMNPNNVIYAPKTSNCPYKEPGHGGTTDWNKHPHPLTAAEQKIFLDLLIECQKQAIELDGYSWRPAKHSTSFFKDQSNVHTHPTTGAKSQFKPTSAASVFAPTAILPVCFNAVGMPGYP